jgi:arylsulfatase A-like enzyme
VNVVLVFADQMRGQDMSPAGNPEVITPNLERMAGGGTLFTGAYANSPVCTPSRGSLLTGCYPRTHRAVVNDVPVRTDMPSMGTIFRDAGYATGYVGKWHLDGCPRDKFTPPGPRRLGFDYWAVHNCTHKYFDSFYYADTDERVPIEGYEPITQTDLALRFIEQNAEGPFCLVLSWGPPHNPYELVPERFKAMYDPGKIGLRPNVPEDRAARAREEIAGYRAHITALDELLGRLMDKLEELSLAEDTLVVFTSDHGDMLHSQGQVRKQQPWEESISVPLIARGPGVPAGRRTDGLIGIVDLLPTILGLNGMAVPESMQGRDLSALVQGRGPGRDAVLIMDVFAVDEGYHQGITEWRGLRTRQHTYARNIDGPWVLYDNAADPYQQRNLVDDPASARTLDELDRQLEREIRSSGELLQPWEEIVREMGLVELWNVREEHLHGGKGRFLEP